jgi:hypothetical protein
MHGISDDDALGLTAAVMNKLMPQLIRGSPSASALNMVLITLQYKNWFNTNLAENVVLGIFFCMT